MKSDSLRSEADQALADRYRLLSLAILESLHSEQSGELTSLISERSLVLGEIEEFSALSDQAKAVLLECAKLDVQIDRAMAQVQGATVNHLVGSFKGRQGSRHYRRGDPSAPQGAFFAEG